MEVLTFPQYTLGFSLSMYQGLVSILIEGWQQYVLLVGNSTVS